MNMEDRSLEECVVTAMECNVAGLVKHLPYILQDIWEIGTSTEEVIAFIKKHQQNYAGLDVLDLGSGKGAVSVKVAAELGCRCLGIDAIEDFVAFSNSKAKEYSVDSICTFETGDIRTMVKTLGKYDVIILGSIGPVFGDYHATLSELAPHLKSGGLIIIDDAYIADDSDAEYPGILRKSELEKQVADAGMKLIDEITINEIQGATEVFDDEFRDLRKRCLELVEKYPEDKDMLLAYVERQKREYEALTTDITPAMFAIGV